MKKELVVSKEKFAGVSHMAVNAGGASAGNLNVSNFLKVSVVGNEVEAAFINPDALSVVAKEKLDASISEPVSFLLDKNKAKNIQLLRGEEIKITLEDNTMTVFSGDDSEPSVWNTLDVTLYPQVPVFAASPRLTFSMGLDEFKAKYKFVKPAIAVDQSRPILATVMCIAEGNNIYMTALDGVRMNVEVLEMPQTFPQKITFNIPTKLAEFVSTLKGEGNLQFNLYDQVISAHYEDEQKSVLAFEKLVNAEIIDFRQVLAKPVFSVMLNKSALVESVERLIAFTNEAAKTSLQMTMKEGSNKLVLKMENENEVNKDTIVLESNPSKDLVIGFNQKYVMDVLKAFGSGYGTLSLGFIDSVRQVLITPNVDGEDRQFPFGMVLPIRTRES